jgi:hypothetical protein
MLFCLDWTFLVKLISNAAELRIYVLYSANRYLPAENEFLLIFFQWVQTKETMNIICVPIVMFCSVWVGISSANLLSNAAAEFRVCLLSSANLYLFAENEVRLLVFFLYGCK